jgi:hypothetical protein
VSRRPSAGVGCGSARASVRRGVEKSASSNAPDPLRSVPARDSAIDETTRFFINGDRIPRRGGYEVLARPDNPGRCIARELFHTRRNTIPGHRGKAVGLLGVLDIGDRLGVQVLQGLVEGTVSQRQLRGPARAPGGNAGDELQHRTEVKPREAGPGDASVLRNATPDIQPRPERYGGRDLLHAPPVRRPKWQFPVATSPATADQNEPDFNASLGWGISSSYSWTEAA